MKKIIPLLIIVGCVFIAVFTLKYNSPKKDVATSQKQTEIVETNPCNQNSANREVISKIEKTFDELSKMNFDEVKWDTYSNKDLGISFDYPKEIYVVDKRTPEDKTSKDAMFIISNCGNDIASISITFDKNIIKTNLDMMLPENIKKYETAHNSKLKITETSVGGQKAFLTEDTTKTDIPTDVRIVTFYDDSNNPDHMVVIYTFKKDIEGYLMANKQEWPKEILENYSQFSLKIADKFLNSIKFN